MPILHDLRYVKSCFILFDCRNYGVCYLKVGMVETSVNLAAVVTTGETRFNEINIFNPIFNVPRQSSSKDQNYINKILHTALGFEDTPIIPSTSPVEL